MPKYVFPNTSSGINVDDHLNDFLLENDLQGIHGHVDPAQSNPIDMNYFRGKIAFHYNAYSSGSGNVEMIYPSASGTGQQIIGGPSNSYKAFLHDIHSSGTFYDSASFVANPDSGYVFKEWRVDSISGSIVGTNAQLDIVVDTTDNYNTSQSFYAIFDGCQLVIEATSQSCALIINGSTPACNVGFTATVSTNTPVAAPTAPTPIPTAPSPIPTAPTPIPTAPSPIPTAPTPIPTAPTPAPAVAPTASPVPAPAVAPTASPVPALAPAKAPVVTPVAVQCYEYDLTSDGGDTVAFTYTRCDGTSQTSTVPNGDSITVCAQSGSVTMNPGSGTIVAGNTCTSGPSPSPAVAPTASPVPAPAAPTPIPTAPSPTSPSPAPTSSVSPQALAPQPAPVTTPTAPTPQPAISPTGSAPTPSPVAPSPSPTAPTPVPNAPTPVPTVAPTASPVPAPITIAPQPAPVTTPTAPTPVPAVAPTGSESIPTPSPLAPSPVPTAPSPIPTAPSPAPTGTEPTPTVAPRALVTPTSEDPEGPGEPTPSPSPTSGGGGGGGSPISEGLEPSPEQPNAE